MGDPFLFIGHGFATSARNLEGYLWFERPPGARSRTWIARQLPRALAAFCRFDGVLAHFGSDDDLESWVGSSDAEPGRARWRAFCDQFEAALRAIHERDPLVAAVKADDGAYGRRTSSWHRRSVQRSGELAARAVDAGYSSGLWLDFATNLLEDVLPDRGAASKLPAAARTPWLRWLDALARTRRHELRGRFVECAARLLEAVPDRKRPAALGTMRPAFRRAIEALPDQVTPAAATRVQQPQIGSPSKGRTFPVVFGEVVLPALREIGYQGSRTRMRRTLDGRTHVLWFDIDREASVAPCVSVGLSALPPRKDSTLKQDFDRALGQRYDRQRRQLGQLLAPAERGLLWYEEAEGRWGRRWRNELASFLVAALLGPADRWLRAPGRGSSRR